MRLELTGHRAVPLWLGPQSHSLWSLPGHCSANGLSESKTARHLSMLSCTAKTSAAVSRQVGPFTKQICLWNVLEVVCKFVPWAFAQLVQDTNPGSFIIPRTHWSMTQLQQSFSQPAPHLFGQPLSRRFGCRRCTTAQCHEQQTPDMISSDLWKSNPTSLALWPPLDTHAPRALLYSTDKHARFGFSSRLMSSSTSNRPKTMPSRCRSSLQCLHRLEGQQKGQHQFVLPLFD